MNREPEFSIEQQTESYILIRDLAEQYQCISVTNGAEEVIAALNQKLKGRKLFYIDTEGCVDELCYIDKEFTGFKFGFKNEKEFNEHFKGA